MNTIGTIQVGPHLLIQGTIEAKGEDGRMAKVSGTWGYLVNTTVDKEERNND